MQYQTGALVAASAQLAGDAEVDEDDDDDDGDDGDYKLESVQVSHILQ